MHSETIKLARGTLTGQLCYKQPTERLIIVCHGYQSSSEHPSIVTITQALNNKGYSTFNFNFSDQGGLNVEQQVSDIILIAKHFNAYREIILMAGSFGALSASIAAKSPRIKGLITINGFFGSGKLGRKHYPTFIIFKTLSLINPRHKKTWNFFKQEFQPTQITAPALIVHSKVDKIVPIIQSTDFFKKLTGSKQFVQLETADHHLTSDADISNIVTAVDEWLQKLS